MRPSVRVHIPRHRSPESPWPEAVLHSTIFRWRRGVPAHIAASGEARPVSAHRCPVAAAGSSASVAALALGGTVPAEAPAASASRPKGYDVSSHQKSVNRAKARARGARFVHVKATESTTYRNPHIRQQYDGSRRAGLIRGASRFACPTASRAGRRRRTSYATGAPGEPTGAHCRPLSASHTTRTTARRSATGPARPGRPPASARSATRPTGARAAGL